MSPMLGSTTTSDNTDVIKRAEERASKVKKITELLEQKLSANKLVKDKHRAELNYFKIKDGEVKTIEIDVSNNDSLKQVNTSFQDSPRKQKKYRYMVRDIAFDLKVWQNWDVTLNISDELDKLIALGYTKVKVSRVGSGKTDTKYTIEGVL